MIYFLIVLWLFFKIKLSNFCIQVRSGFTICREINSKNALERHQIYSYIRILNENLALLCLILTLIFDFFFKNKIIHSYNAII